MAISLKYSIGFIIIVAAMLFAEDSDNSDSPISPFLGRWEIGGFSGYQRYGRNDSPVDAFFNGLYVPYHFSDSWFFQPVATLAFGLQGVNNRSYFNLGGKFGVMTPWSPCHFYHASGFAYQNSWGYSTGMFGDQVPYGYSGFVMPMEWGVKIDLPPKVGLLTLAFHLSVGNENENTQWGYGFTAGYSFLK